MLAGPSSKGSSSTLPTFFFLVSWRDARAEFGNLLVLKDQAARRVSEDKEDERPDGSERKKRTRETENSLTLAVVVPSTRNIPFASTSLWPQASLPHSLFSTTYYVDVLTQERSTISSQSLLSSSPHVCIYYRITKRTKLVGTLPLFSSLSLSPFLCDAVSFRR